MKKKVTAQEAADLLGIEVPKNKMLADNLAKFVQKQGVDNVRNDPERYQREWRAIDPASTPLKRTGTEG
jgi:hypothetical protein